MMGKFTIVPAVTVVVLLITISFSGCTRETPITNNTTSIPVLAEATLRPNLPSPDTRPASGHVYLDSKPVAGASVLAAALDGSDSLLAMTDSNGAYVLNIRPDTRYNVTTYDNGLIHTILPIYLDSRGTGYHMGKDVADKYDIVLTRGQNSTITGITAPGWVLVIASPVDGGPSVTAASNYTGQYSLKVEPGVEYRLSGRDYYEQIKFMGVYFYYHNSDPVDTVRIDSDETALIDIIANYPPP
jgi:hypothetical protein